MMKWVTRWIVDHAKPGKDVIELGSGKGEVAVALAKDGYAVTAVDRDAQVMEIAKKAARAAGVADDITWIHGNIEQLGMIRSESYATVVLSFSLHHVDDPQKALKEAWRLLSPGGRLLIAEMLPRGPKAGDECHRTSLDKWLALFATVAPEGLDLHVRPGDENVLAFLTKQTVTAPALARLVS